MNDKNNIEDFFNNSLDSFHNEPSDRVWEGVESLLGTPIPFWRTLWFGGFLVAILLLLVGFWMYRNSVQQEIQSLSIEKGQLERKNMELEAALKNCSTSKEQLSILEMEKGQLKESLDKNEVYLSQDISELKAEIQELKKSQIKARNLNLEGSSTIEKGKLTVQENDSEVEYNSLDAVEEEQSDVKNQISKESTTLLDDKFEKEDDLRDEFDNERKTYVNIQDLHSEQNVAIAFNRNIQKDSVFLLKVRAAEILAIQNLIKGEAVFQPSMRFGVNATGLSIFSNLKETPNFGYSGGLSIHFQAFENFALTGGINFNSQRYELSGASNQVLINEFPHIAQVNQTVKSVNTRNHYFDVPIGIKWNMPLLNSRSDLYLYTGVAWQLYLPQNFTYLTESDIPVNFKEQRYFAYFGTIFVNPGIEREINPKLRYNLSIWVEKGLTDFGLEDRDVFNIGIRGGLLFGR